MGTVAKLSLLGALFALSACSGSSSPATAAAPKLPPGSGGDDAGEVQGSDAGGTVTPPTGDDAGSPAADAGGGEDAATGSDAGEVDATTVADHDAGPNVDAGADAQGDAGVDASSVDASDGSAIDAADAGCSHYWQCPAGFACDVSTGACTTTCSATQGCNTGCCNSASGTCTTAVTGATCPIGDSDLPLMCTDCAAGAQTGSACVAVGPVGFAQVAACGCGTVADCSGNQACGSVAGCAPGDTTCGAHFCSAHCDLNHPCKTGCCNDISDTCVAGDAGASGAWCGI